MAKPVNKIVGKLATKATNLLEQELAQVAGVAPINQWGGTSGCIALVLKQEAFRDATDIADRKFAIRTKPDLVYPDISRDPTPYKRIVKQEDTGIRGQSPYQPYFWMRRPPIPQARNKEYMGFARGDSKDSH